MKHLLRFTPFAAVPLLAVLAGCPKQSAVWLVDGTTPGRPVFGIGTTRGGDPLSQLNYFALGRCGTFDDTAASAVWVIRQDTARVAPRQLRYGEVPRGYATVKAGPPELAAGCYVARIDGMGRLAFTVRSDGRAVEATP